MKIFLLICLVTGLASSEKLDRTYLPPPGSKFSGGHPGDIQVPLEFPKETYLTGQPQPHNRIPELDLGFSRRPKPVGSAQSFTEKPSGFTYFQNSYPVPTTTTSYAITQTTTFAPPEEYNGLDQSLSSLNGTLSKRPQGSGPIHQQEPNRGQLGNTPFYDQFGNNQQSLNPYGSTSQRPIFPSNRKPETYLPPVSSIHKLPGQVPSSQNDLSYPSGQPQGTSYQDRQQYSSTYGPVTNQPGFTTPQANQRNQFIGNANVPVSTAAPQYQEGRFGSTTMPDINKQRFSSPVPTQPNSYFPISTTGPDYQDKIRLTKPGSEVQYQYVQNQNLPGSTAEPQYQGGQRIITPGLDLQNQLVSSTASPNYQNSQNDITPGSEQQRFPQNLNNYHVNHNFPTSTSAPRFQNGQQFTTPGSVHLNQYLGNQKIPSTSSSQYQDGQSFVKPSVPTETIGPNQEVFGTRIPSRQNQKQFPGNQSFLSSTETPHSQNEQLFTTPGSEQSNQYFGNQDIPSTNFPQYQDGQQNINRPGVPQKFVPNQQVFGSRVPSQQKENQIYPSTTVIPQFTDSIRLTPGSIQQSLSDPAQQNQYQYQGHQNYPSSTAAPQFITPGPGPSQFLGNQNIPTSGPQFQNSQRFNTPRAPEQYPNNYTSNENQQYPSTATPQYQSTFTPTPGPNQQGVVGVSQFPTQPNYNQLFPSSTTAPQQFSTAQAQYGNDGVQSVAIITSSQPGTGSQGFTQSFPEAQATSSTIIGALPIGGYPTAVSGLESQSRPERPQEASDRNAEILSYQNVLTPEGYSYSYDTSNGIHADETGVVGDGTKAQGGFSYTGDDGKVYSVFYSADENGFQPRGDHLPTPPPIPEAIQRVIEQANKDKKSGTSDDGSYNEEKYGHMKYNGKSTLLGPKNKTDTLINGEDTPNKYENRFSTQKKNQFTPEAKNKEGDTENEEENIEDSEIDGGDMKIMGEIKSRIQSKSPTKLKNITAEDKKAKSRNRNNFKSHPAPDMKNEEEEMTRDDPSSDVSDSDDDFDSEDESDGVNYKDDPNSRTDFHGTNKYLPNPKRVSKINQIHNRRPGLPKGAKQLTKEANKQRTPNNRKSQTHKMVYEDEQEYIADRIRNPSRKNKPGQKITDNSKFGQPDFTDINGGYENKKISKSKHSKNKDETKGNIDEETGYEYTTPHRKFNSEEEAQFPTRTSGTENIKPISQKGSQTTLRPFMAPNVYGDDEETTDREKFELDNHGKYQRPLRPFSVKKGKYPGSEKESNRDNDYVTPEAVDDGQFGSTMPPTRITPTRRPFGRPQSTPAADYGDINANGQNEYNTPSNNQNSRRPGHKVIYTNNAPNKEVSNVESIAFVSLTPLSPSSLDSNEYQQSNQYHSMRKPTDGSFYEENAPGKDTIVRRPATNNISRIPSTTYRPNSFVDRTSPSSVTADGFGRPISSTTPEIISGGVYENEPDVTTDLRPGVGRFGVTYAPTQVPEYQGSTSAPIGEDFSGPKRPQGFDPETGYYYK